MSEFTQFHRKYWRWVLPFAMPFAVLFFLRMLWWAAGAEWTQPAFAAAVAVTIGGFTGLIVSIVSWGNDV